MNKYFIVEIFPKSGFSIQSLKGKLNFKFHGRNCYLAAEETPMDFKTTTSSRGEKIKPNYRPLNLYISDSQEESIFKIIEKVCDILSLATNNHINYFSPTINEYEYIPSWSYGEFQDEEFKEQGLKHWDSEKDFLYINILHKIIKKTEISDIKDRIFASAHLNRLAKYKSFSHITEAITDCVCSLEALYMCEQNGRQDLFDRNIISSGINGKTQAFEYFLDKYFPGNQKELQFIQKLNPYKIRSAYLHRGFLIEPPRNINVLFKTLEGSNRFQIYNIFYKIIFLTIINFILNQA